MREHFAIKYSRIIEFIFLNTIRLKSHHFFKNISFIILFVDIVKRGFLENFVKLFNFKRTVARLHRNL